VSFHERRLAHHHYYDEHDNSPRKTLAHSLRHNALIKHHFPNADTSITDNAAGISHIVVDLHNLHDLKPRPDGA
jgi:hypothetical protein